jgi:NADH:ubiquinone oxidoreductase subunit K
VSVLVVSCALFSLGLYGVLTRRDLVGILASIEVLVGAPLVLLTGWGAGLGGGAGIEAVGLLVVVLAAAEAAIGLALVVAAAGRVGTTRIDDMTEVKG